MQRDVQPAPCVSVVLPTFNGKRFLAAAVQSVLSQTWQDLELIIVDDGSTDGTWEHVQDLARADARIRTHLHPVNRRLPAALNTGFGLVRGRYCSWTSDDNLYRPNALARLVQTMDDRPEIGAVYSDYSIIDEAGTCLRAVNAPEPKLFLDMLADHCTPCFLYRSALVAKLGAFSEEFFMREDQDYWLRVLLAAPVAHLAEDLCCYRRHRNSLTVSRPWEGQVVAHRLYYNWLPRLPHIPKRRKGVLYADMIHLLADAALRCRQGTYLRMAWVCLLRSFLHYPPAVLSVRAKDMAKLCVGTRGNAVVQAVKRTLCRGGRGR
jgi:glycosyltransferase involved in cell wall biosynthesis